MGYTDGKGTHPYNMKLSETSGGRSEDMAGAKCVRCRIANQHSRLGETKNPSHRTRNRMDRMILKDGRKTGEWRSSLRAKAGPGSPHSREGVESSCARLKRASPNATCAGSIR